MSEALTSSPLLLVQPEQAYRLEDEMRCVKEQGCDGRLEMLGRHKDGNLFDIDIAISPMMSEGVYQGMVCSIRDIRALKQVERMKDAFVSNVSHELRTPITSLMLFLGLLEKASPDEMGELLAVLKRETNRLFHIVEDVLRLSRLDQGRVELVLDVFNLNTIVEEYVTDRSTLAASRSLHLLSDLKPDLPPIEADQGLIGQVMGALLTNALNYTPGGGTVQVSTGMREQLGRTWVGFTVSDTGPGIAPDEQAHLFERFYRGSVGHSSGVPGTGLGLAIVKEILTRHEGMVEVHSEGQPGKGTSFSVWLPSYVA